MSNILTCFQENAAIMDGVNILSIYLMRTPIAHASTSISWLTSATLGWHGLDPASKGHICVKFDIDVTVCWLKHPEANKQCVIQGEQPH